MPNFCFDPDTSIPSIGKFKTPVLQQDCYQDDEKYFPAFEAVGRVVTEFSNWGNGEK